MTYKHRQLTFAREYRGYSQTELAQNVQGLSQSNLSKYEKGFGSLSNDMVLKIINFLEFPESWLYQDICNLPENAHYRKRTTISQAGKTEIETTNRLIGYIVDQMSNSLHWPEFNLKSFDLEDGYTPETVAKYARKILGIAPGSPVANIFSLLENNGIIVVEIHASEKFDGVSFITDKGNPLIIINKAVPADRKRRTLAHELGHLLMHGFSVPEHRTDKIKEDEAERFASEFLMPADFIRNSLIGLKLTYLGELKRYWLTSMASIIRRAKDLRCISNEKYVYFNIELSRNGQKKDEKIIVHIDEPSLYNEAYKLHTTVLEYTELELGNAFNLPLDVIERFFNPYKLRVVA